MSAFCKMVSDRLNQNEGKMKLHILANNSTKYLNYVFNDSRETSLSRVLL